MGAAPILTILRDGETIKSVPIEGEAVLGRADACVIRLEDRAISRQHAVFRATAEGVQVEKKSEFAPLVVNGAECTRAVVKEGDVISIGPYLMKVALPKGPAYRSEPVDPGPSPNAGSSEPTAPIPVAELGGLEAGAGEAPAGLDGLSAASGSLEALPGLEDPLASPVPELGEAGAPAGEEGESKARLPENSQPSHSYREVSEPSAMIGEDAATRVMSNQKLVARLAIPPESANVVDYELNLDDGQEISIGRGKNCEIVLKDKKASRKHTVIRFEGGRYVVIDQGSANGTWVNGEQVSDPHGQALYSDDVVKIGGVELVFFAESADYPERERDFLKVPDEEPPEAAAEGAEPMPGELPLEMPPTMDSGDPGMAAGLPPPDGFAGAGMVMPNAVPGQPGGDASLGAVPGIVGISAANSGKKKSLIARLNEMPPARRYIIIGAIIALVYFGLVEDDTTPTKIKHPNKGSKAPTGQLEAKTQLTFEKLSEKDKQFVITTHDLAFEYYKNKDYDSALYQLRQIFAKFGEEFDYSDIRELRKYAEEGKRRKEQMEREARIAEEETKRKAQVGLLLDEARSQMRRHLYEQARETFGQILPLDPENQQVQAWRKEIESWEEEQRLVAQQKQVQKEINTQAREIMKEALALEKKAKYRSAIAIFGKVREINPPDSSITDAAIKHIAHCKAAIRRLRDPLLNEAKQLEASGEFAKAFALYRRATLIDPDHPEGFAGMNRIRGTLHERAKVLYTEAVLAESYSDFVAAKAKYAECLKVAPPDDTYHDRAERKLARFTKEATFTNPDDAPAARDTASDKGPGGNDSNDTPPPPPGEGGAKP